MTTELLDAALIEEATKKSGLIWVRGAQGVERALWHVWHEGAALMVGDGPGEQPLPGLADGGTATVTVRSKDKGGRIVGWQATVVELAAGTQAWDAAVSELKGKRLNAPDGEALPARWGRECRVLRLEPVRGAGVVAASEGDLAAPPLPSPAITRDAVPAGVPRLLGRRRRK